MKILVSLMSRYFIFFLIVVSAYAVNAGDNHSESKETNETKPWEMTMDEFREKSFVLAPGKTMEPGNWPNNSRVGVLISFDVDNEALIAVENAGLLASSFFQFGSQKGVKRIVNLLDSHDVPATFFIPAVVLKLRPELATTIKTSGNHEFGAHGWIHEPASKLTPDEQKAYLKKSVDEITRITGEKPVGYRSPYGVFTEHTLPALKELGFLYDSSVGADDVPYELMYKGKATGLVELPASINLEDSILDPMNTFTRGIQSPSDTLQSYKDAFDVAYQEGGMILVIMHPHVAGKQSRIGVLKGLIEYAKSHEGVWFGTHRDAAIHFNKQLNKQ